MLAAIGTGLFTGLGWAAALCLVAGLALMIAEMLLPGFGVSGILGLVLLIVGVVLASRSVTEGLILIAAILVILGVAFVLLYRSASKGAMWRSPIVLKRRAAKEEGYVSASDQSFLLGERGVSATVLRPSGIGIFSGKKVDVVTEAEFLDKDTPIVVTAVQGGRVVVKAADGETAKDE